MNKSQEQIVIETLAMEIAQMKIDNAFLKAQIQKMNEETNSTEKDNKEVTSK